MNIYTFRYKVLRHHPDKRRALGEDIREDDDYFTCITKVSNLSVNLQKMHIIAVILWENPLFLISNCI